ncbi:MAG: hypothetical protein OXM87_06345 [Truepera sp.]|nr:hypothetical protein [Truepera sp.]
MDDQRLGEIVFEYNAALQDLAELRKRARKLADEELAAVSQLLKEEQEGDFDTRGFKLIRGALGGQLYTYPTVEQLTKLLTGLKETKATIERCKRDIAGLGLVLKICPSSSDESP